MSAVIGDGEIGVGTLPARTTRSSTGREVSRHLGCIAVEVVPDRALDVGEVGGRVIDGGGRWGGDGEIGRAVDGAYGGGDGNFAGGRSGRHNRNKLGGGAGAERGGDAVEFDGVGAECGAEIRAGDGHARPYRPTGGGECGDGGDGRGCNDGSERDRNLRRVQTQLITCIERINNCVVRSG